MNSVLTREDILGLQDITTKEITIPETIPVWAGKKIYIKQLSRGKQDDFLKRQFGSMKVRQEASRNAKQQEMTAPDLYGHDTWLFVNGVCDENGMLLFKLADMDVLNNKSGEAIGYIAKQILEFSNMTEDVNDLETMENDIKNSLEMAT